jgi:hypothetical protein
VLERCASWTALSWAVPLTEMPGQGRENKRIDRGVFGRPFIVNRVVFTSGRSRSLERYPTSRYMCMARMCGCPASANCEAQGCYLAAVAL